MTGNDYALVLRTGEQLSRRAVSCPTGEYAVVHQHDGNVVLYRNADAAPIWASGTVFQPGVSSAHGERTAIDAAYGRPGRLLLREDGDLVVLSAQDKQLWASGTPGRGITSLMIHDWGKLALKNDRGHILWQTDRAPRRWDGWNAVPDGRRLRRGQTLRGQTLTSHNGRYSFVTTFDGAAYLCRAGGPVLWTAFISAGDGLEMTQEGGLGSRSPDGISRPGNGIGLPHDLNAAELFVSDDGRLTLADDDGQILWAGAPAPDAAEQRLSRPRRRTTGAAGTRRGGRHKQDGPGATVPKADTRLKTPSTPVIRTDFSDDERWRQVCAEIEMSHDLDGQDVSADVSFVEHPDFAGLAPDALVRMVPEDGHAIALVVDWVTLSDPEHPVLVVELDGRRTRTFRALPHTLQGVENNLSLLGNADWSDYAAEVDDDGVLRWDPLWGAPDD